MRALLVLVAVLALAPLSTSAPPGPPAAGLTRVVLPDGFAFWTHGPDDFPPGELWDGIAPPRAPLCVDPATQHHGHVLYAQPTTRPNRLAEVVAPLRENVSASAGLIHQTAVRYGYEANLRMRCDPDGQVTVTHVLIPPGDSYEDIVYAIRNAGHVSPLAKYWVYYDGGSPSGAAGQAMVPSSSQPGVNHPSNTEGPYYAVNYMTTHWTILLHEAAHTMGAVQTGAPHATSTHHCLDGHDLMCYELGTDNGLCPLWTTFDCKGDDYFHPAPPAGSWLATHWNLGHADNLFLSVTPGSPVPAAPASVTATRGPGVGEITVAWTPPPAGVGGAPTGYRVIVEDEGLQPRVVAELGPDARSWLVGDLESSRTYPVGVVAFNAAGEGGLADAAAKTFSLPGPPRDLRATSGVQKVNLLFLPPHDDGGLPLTYRALVAHYPLGAPAFERDLTVGTLPTGQLNAVVWMPDTGTYSFRVVAVNAVGQGWGSNSAVSAAAAP